MKPVGEKKEDCLEESKDNFWEEGSFAETMSSEDMKAKMRTFHMKHTEEMDYGCKKCRVK